MMLQHRALDQDLNSHVLIG